MKNGKSRTQRVQVLASGKYKFVKNIGRKIKRRVTRRKRSSRTRRSRNPSTRRKGGNRMGKGRNIQATVFKWLRVGSLAAPAISRILDPSTQPKEKVERIFEDYSGYNLYDKTFSWESLARGWTPFIATSLVTTVVPKVIAIIRRL